MPLFLLSWYHFVLSFLGALIYRFPSKNIKVIGVTGTKGKTSVVELVSRILEEAGYTTALIDSINFKIKDKQWKNDLKMTMPGRFKIQRFLRKAKDCDYAVLEVTSEGILQYRHRFIDFNTAVFTNLSPEHIERHGSFEKYRQAKAELFKKCKNIHIINKDDDNADYFLEIFSKKKITYSINNQSDNKAELTDNGFQLNNVQFNLKLIGKFNIYNSLAAISIALSQGIDLQTCKKALEKVKGIPGRMEIVIKEPFKVVVDYAHTPDSLEKVYNILKGKRMICVLGSCGGGRDKWRRPKMGQIAQRYCDEIIITNEDPYDEDPMEIIEQIAKGIKARKILDRRQAIKQALQLAESNDIVVITGKGSEIWMCVEKGKKIPWSDVQIVREEYERLK